MSEDNYSSVVALTDSDALTDRQRERRHAVLAAAIDLAARGGYDEVQMREVAKEAEVALGTLYHYFSSKDHLLAAAMVETTAALEQAVSQRPPHGETAQDRVVDVLVHATNAMSLMPHVTKAMVTALNSPGEDVAAAKEALSLIMNRIIGIALAGETDAHDALAPTRLTMARSIEHVWYSTLLAWVNGWMDADQVQEELIDAVRLIVRP